MDVVLMEGGKVAMHDELWWREQRCPTCPNRDGMRLVWAGGGIGSAKDFGCYCIQCGWHSIGNPMPG